MKENWNRSGARPLRPSPRPRRPRTWMRCGSSTWGRRVPHRRPQADGRPVRRGAPIIGQLANEVREALTTALEQEQKRSRRPPCMPGWSWSRWT